MHLPLQPPMHPFTLAQLSDTHVGAEGLLKKGIDTAARLSSAVDWLLSSTLHFDGCLVTGDLVERGSSEEYLRLRDILAPLQNKMPIYLALGNHDGREAFWEVFDDFPGVETTIGMPFVQYSLGLTEGHRLVVLDSHEPGHDGGVLCEQRLDWLSGTLADHRSDRILLVVHHPPFACGNHLFDSIRLADPRSLQAVCDMHGNVDLIVCGHVHRTISASLGRVPVRVGPSTAYPYSIDYASNNKGSALAEPPGLAVHRLLGSPLSWVTHSVLLPNLH